MSDPTKKLKAKFAPNHRYANFGPAISSIRICGFRGIADMRIEFEFPVTAFSGLNGAGKSTVGQLAICAYRKPSTGAHYRRYYVKDFFPVSVADPSPFEPNARVEYSYETNQPNAQQTVTVARALKEWSGYKRQPEGYAFYVGFTLYIPKVERRDLSIYRGSSIDLRATRAIPTEVRAKVGSILNQPYDDLVFQGIGHKNREVELGLATRYGSKYSENNMGFGEGRVLYMVDLMETVPEQSLFVLEEPETSLHEDAQFQLTRYLLDVCDRRHHQMILSTHSSVILEALPPEARKLLLRDSSGVIEFPRISATRARSILSKGQKRGLTVCVEDAFAKLVLTEILRRADPALLKAVAIEPIGDKAAVLNGIRLLDHLSINAIGVRDGDSGADAAKKIFKLPGTKSPELEVFETEKVQKHLVETYGVSVEDFLSIHPDFDPHTLPAALAKEINLLQDALSTDAVRVYVGNLDPSEYSDLVAAIKGAA